MGKSTELMLLHPAVKRILQEQYLNDCSFVTIEKETITEYGLSEDVYTAVPSETKTESVLINNNLLTTLPPLIHYKKYRCVYELTDSMILMVYFLFSKENSLLSILRKYHTEDEIKDMWRNHNKDFMSWQFYCTEPRNDRVAVSVYPVIPLTFSELSDEAYKEMVELYRNIFGVIDLNVNLLEKFSVAANSTCFWATHGNGMLSKATKEYGFWSGYGNDFLGKAAEVIK